MYDLSLWVKTSNKIDLTSCLNRGVLIEKYDSGKSIVEEIKNVVLLKIDGCELYKHANFSETFLYVKMKRVLLKKVYNHFSVDIASFKYELEPIIKKHLITNEKYFNIGRIELNDAHFILRNWIASFLLDEETIQSYGATFDELDMKKLSETL